MSCFWDAAHKTEAIVAELLLNRGHGLKAQAAACIASAECLDGQPILVFGRSELARAVRYARSRWIELTRYLDGGRLEISNNAAENAIRPVALGHKNWLVLGSEAGSEHAAIM